MSVATAISTRSSSGAGKTSRDWSDLIIQAPPLYIQEKVHPKVLIEDLLRQSKQRGEEATPPMPDLFADFNGLPDKEAVTEFYQHDANWSNRMILGEVYNSERHLLYVACTRARDHLLVTGVKRSSEFLDDLSPTETSPQSRRKKC